MNEHIGKDKIMAMTTQEAVAKGAKRFEAAENALAVLARDMTGVVAVVRNSGHIGGIEAMQLTAECGRDINAAYGIIANLHAKLTKRAGELGIDLPTPRSGGR